MWHTVKNYSEFISSSAKNDVFCWKIANRRYEWEFPEETPLWQLAISTTTIVVMTRGFYMNNDKPARFSNT
jgi:hypothetical protein